MKTMFGRSRVGSAIAGVEHDHPQLRHAATNALGMRQWEGAGLVGCSLRERCNKRDDLLGKPTWGIQMDVVAGSRNGYEARVREARAKVTPRIDGNRLIQTPVNL